MDSIFQKRASTITQQLLKNNVFTDWTNESTIERFKRKFQEQYLAVQLEKELKDKQTILENYLNTINLEMEIMECRQLHTDILIKMSMN